MKYIKEMLRLAFSLCLGMMGALAVILGAHGLYVYFNLVPVVFGGRGERLFLFLEVPIEVRDIIILATSWGIQSWIFPALILVGGIFLWKWSNVTTQISDWLS